MRVLPLTLALVLAAPLAIIPGGAPPEAFAQDFAAARRHYQSAVAAEKAGDFTTAVAEYAAAYDITKDPKVLYAIARAYEAAGNKDAAVVYYRRYLNEAKDAKDRDNVKAKIATLEASETPATPPVPAPPAPGTTEPPPAGGGGVTTPPAGTKDLIVPGGAGAGDALPPPGGGEEPPGGEPPSFTDGGSRWQRTAGWVAVGVAAVALTSGAVLGESALSRREDIERLQNFKDPDDRPSEYSGNVKREYEDALAEGDRFETYSLVAFSVAGAAAIGAALFFALDPGPASAPAESTGTAARRPAPAAPTRWLSATPSRDGFGVSAGFRF